MFEEQNLNLSHSEIDYVSCLMGDVGTKMSANNAVPSRIRNIKLLKEAEEEQSQTKSECRTMERKVENRMTERKGNPNSLF